MLASVGYVTTQPGSDSADGSVSFCRDKAVTVSH
jgi:hypothetical protein